MGVPSSNVLKAALRSIKPQSVGYVQYIGRSTNALGYDVAVYSPVVSIRGSFQAMPRRMFQSYGLDLNKEYANFFTPHPVRDVDRDSSGDMLHYAGYVWQILSVTDWSVDGWKEALCVKISAIVPPDEGDDDE
jgi:hypothetical protein